MEKPKSEKTCENAVRDIKEAPAVRGPLISCAFSASEELLGGGQALLPVPDLISLGQHGKQLCPGILLQEFGVLLQLAAHFKNRRHDLFDIPGQRRGNAVMSGLTGKVHGLLALAGLWKPTLFSAET